eukprot:CAMPEP_0185021112 /NCGR_PEP_ID=MMETSP1103-20130426/3776_1 /TAXON_ID=36769 /ORGANISM="Paraphysomonas bandaiensis, Strain Caron Lab Isolate" /LENGTH=274 /DNA_ID=CAMNT_0027552437 /DNA_START=115 /DNA_END=939 /DNA_ORIENTATION=+
MSSAFLTGDNSNVVPTDTCKNTIYCLGKKNSFQSIEQFGIIVARHFMTEYPDIVNKVSVNIKRDSWERVVCPDSNGRMRPHSHAFKRVGPSVPYTVVTGTASSPGRGFAFSVRSGVRGLTVLKTTQSGFTNFHKCQYTSLPEDSDRILATSIEAEWEYDASAVANPSTPFDKIYNDVETSLLNTIVGPADTGVYSKSVQETLYIMAEKVIQQQPSINKVSIYMPNIHNLVFPLEKYGIKNADHTGKPDIFYPIDEPHGIIKAEVQRTPRFKSRL